jgi:hypothetical protein
VHASQTRTGHARAAFEIRTGIVPFGWNWLAAEYPLIEVSQAPPIVSDHIDVPETSAIRRRCHGNHSKEKNNDDRSKRLAGSNF